MKYTLIFTILFSMITHAMEGTETHREQEYRRAYSMSSNLGSKGIKDIQDYIQRLINGKYTRFDKLLKEQYYLEGNFHSFLFKDYYFDTEDYKILKNNNVYRLRYRWKNAADYFKYKYLPLQSYYPSRCEIQFKYDYSLTGMSEVKESRFEFRNDSFPFNKNKDAPLPPWEYEEYVNYIKSGVYKSYEIKPSSILKTKNPKVNLSNLKNVVTTETIRVRNHINIKNIFGDLPNPEQAIILTVDFVYPDKGESFIELELELDRSIGKNMNNIIYDKSRREDVRKEVFRIKKILLNDIHFIYKNVDLYIQKKLRLTPLKDNFKYRRIISSQKD